MTVFFDTHAHLDYPDYSADLPGAIERAHAVGVAKLISVGTDLASSERAIQIAEKYPNVFAAVGWHPNDALLAPEDLRPELRAMSRHPKVVALGETGLDYFRLSKEPAKAAEVAEIKKKQAALFLQHLEVAAEVGLNCIVHQRSSLEDTLALMQPFVGKLRGVFHCFSDGPDVLQRVLAMGAFVSFTGIITFKNSETVRDSLAAAPDGRFMLETDCPFLAPVPYRGKRCEPAYLRETASVAAATRKCSLEELGQSTCQAAFNFFPKLKG